MEHIFNRKRRWIWYLKRYLFLLEAKMKVHEAIKYLKDLESTRERFKCAGNAIGNQNIINNLSKEDCKLAVALIDKEIERIRNSEVN